jgi:hypothetical protein
MRVYFQAKLGPLYPAALIALLLSACLTVEQAGEGPGEGPRTIRESAAEEASALYRQELRISLWEEAPPGLETGEIPALTLGLELPDTEILAGGAGETERALERLLRDTLYRGLSVRDYTGEQLRVQTLEYRAMGEEARHNIRLVNSASLNWDYRETFQIPVNSARLLVLRRDRFFYSGGAHPNHDRTYFVFDRELAMRIGLADSIRSGGLAALKELVNRELRLQKKIGPGDSLKKAFFFVDEAEVPESYFFSPRGLGFHWDPYEIAPYAEGHVEVLLPYADVWELLGPEGRRLAREFDAD